jgi:HEAT repeat protein
MIGLSRVGDARVAPVLMQMLNDPECDVKKQAIRFLGELKDSRSASVLQQIMADRSDREFHALAKEALDNLAKV